MRDDAEDNKRWSRELKIAWRSNWPGSFQLQDLGLCITSHEGDAIINYDEEDFKNTVNKHLKSVGWLL
jgi:hypothetical protein